MIDKFPKPPSIMMNTDIEIIQEIDGEDGVTEALVYKGKCYYEEAIRRVLDENRQVIELSGLAIVYTNLVFNKAFIRIERPGLLTEHLDQEILMALFIQLKWS